MNGKKKNEGYTLVELIVTILITGMIVTIIMMFISLSRTSYDEVKKEAVLQDESNMASSYIGDIAIEASACDSEAFALGGNQYKVLSIKAPDPEYQTGDRYSYYFIILWEETTQMLRFCKVKDDAIVGPNGFLTAPTGSQLIFLPNTNHLDYKAMLAADALNVIGNNRALLAKYVKEMDVILPDVSANRNITKITFHFQYRDKDFILSKNVAGRNIN